jgi:hypothetical protein
MRQCERFANEKTRTHGADLFDGCLSIAFACLLACLEHAQATHVGVAAIIEA